MDQLSEVHSEIRKNLIKGLLRKMMDNKKVIKNEILKVICSSPCLLGAFLAQLQNLNKMSAYGYEFYIWVLALNRESP